MDAGELIARDAFLLQIVEDRNDLSPRPDQADVFGARVDNGGESAAVKLHATELLLLLGTAIVLLLERPAESQADAGAAPGDLSLQQSQLPYNR